jgi:lipoate-protein ligase A
MSAVTASRLIVDPPASGVWNMAVDEALLVAAADDDVATLRLYQWQAPTLSIGYFQGFRKREQHLPSRHCPMVRRQSGGGAILHDSELTYSLVLPQGHVRAEKPQQLYATVHKEIIRVLNSLRPADRASGELGIVCGEQPAIDGNLNFADEEPFLCFERRAPGDVVFSAHEAVQTGSEARLRQWKIVGSAQRRRRSALLQHGSILLSRSAAAPELPGFADLAGGTITASTLLTALATAIGKILGVPPEPVPLPAPLVDRAEQIARAKYGADSWTNRR